MTQRDLEDIVELTSLAAGDLFYTVDVSASPNRGKKITVENILSFLDSDTRTFTNKTLTSAVLNTSVSGTAVLDEDTMSSDSATQLATQQSIKAYVDTNAGISNVVEDTTPQLGGDLDGQDNNLDSINSLYLNEKAAANADIAGDGQVWVKTATPNILFFTDDAGTDFQIATLSGTETLTNKTISLTNNTVSGTTAEFNTALSDGSFATLAGTETLTNKTIDGDNNTISNLVIGSEVSATTVAGATLKISGTGGTGFIDFDEITTPANPSADDGRLYVKDSGGTTTLYFRDSAGTETDLLAGGGSSLPVADTTSIVEGSADATKELRFEVDGFTTGTVRVITPPDADITLVNTTDGLIRDANVNGISASKITAGQLALARGGTGQDFSTLSGNANKVIAVNSGETALELQTKKSLLLFQNFSYDQTKTGDSFLALYSELVTSTESSAQYPYSKAHTITRLYANVRVNATTADSTLAYRDDGADATSINLGQTTGVKDSGAISASVVADSDINLRLNHGSNNRIACDVIAVEGEVSI